MINTNSAINPPSQDLCDFIIDKIGISESALELGVKRCTYENCPLPIILWSYGLINQTQLNTILLWLKDN